MSAISDIGIERLRNAISYNPETGALVWRERPVSDFASNGIARSCNTRLAGKPAFKKITNEGYRAGKFLRRELKAHRVAWAVYYGVDPGDLQIDHLNGDRADNRIANLRLADNSINRMNQARRSDNTSGVTGVSRRGNRWIAQLCVRGVRKYIGAFTSREEAAAARVAEQNAVGFGPNHGRASA